MPEKPQDIINGKWTIHNIVAYSRIMTIDKSTAEKLIGSSLQISPSSIQSDASATKSILLPTDADTTPTLVNPSYNFTLLDKQKEEEDLRSPSLKQLELTGNEVYRVDIYKDKQLEDQWSLGILLLDPSQTDRMILSTNGVYYELDRME